MSKLKNPVHGLVPCGYAHCGRLVEVREDKNGRLYTVDPMPAGCGYKGHLPTLEDAYSIKEYPGYKPLNGPRPETEPAPEPDAGPVNVNGPEPVKGADSDGPVKGGDSDDDGFVFLTGDW